MKSIIRDVSSGTLTELDNIESIKLAEECVLGIDCASHTGLSIISLQEGTPLYSLYITRGTKDSKVRYKIGLKRVLKQLLYQCPEIKYIAYEEPYMRKFGVAESLLTFKTLLEEIIIEEEPKLDYIQCMMMPNKTWKKTLLGKLPQSNSKVEKSLITQYITNIYPMYADVSQDERDALGIAITLRKHIIGDIKIVRKKKVRAFKYEIQFIEGTRLDEVVTHKLPTNLIPDKVRANGIITGKLIKNADINKKIYRLMTEDDKVIVLEMKTKNVPQLIEAYNLGEISTPNLYAVVWRKNRKK